MLRPSTARFLLGLTLPFAALLLIQNLLSPSAAVPAVSIADRRQQATRATVKRQMQERVALAQDPVEAAAASQEVPAASAAETVTAAVSASAAVAETVGNAVLQLSLIHI